MISHGNAATPDLSAVSWRRSSRSNSGGNGNCVEVASLVAAVAIRDSKDCEGDTYPVLAVDPASWRGFVNELKTTA